MSQNLDIGKIETSKKSNVNNKLKPKDKSGFTIFCINGCGFQFSIIDSEGKERCPVCKKIIVRKSTHESFRKRLDEFIEKNGGYDSKTEKFNPQSIEKLKIPILFNRQFLWLEIGMIIKYSESTSIDYSQLESFVNHLKLKCDTTKM